MGFPVSMKGVKKKSLVILVVLAALFGGSYIYSSLREIEINYVLNSTGKNMGVAFAKLGGAVRAGLNKSGFDDLESDCKEVLSLDFYGNIRPFGEDIISVFVNKDEKICRVVRHGL